MIRPYESEDYRAIAEIFSAAVHEIACEVYTKYIIAYVFLFVVSAVLAGLGRKRKIKRYLNAATFLVLATPFLPIVMMIVLDAVAS